MGGGSFCGRMYNYYGTIYTKMRNAKDSKTSGADPGSEESDSSKKLPMYDQQK
jgi:hypothetical protein